MSYEFYIRGKHYRVAEQDPTKIISGNRFRLFQVDEYGFDDEIVDPGVIRQLIVKVRQYMTEIFELPKPEGEHQWPVFNARYKILDNHWQFLTDFDYFASGSSWEAFMSWAKYYDRPRLGETHATTSH